MTEDVFPIENGGFPASNVSLPEGTQCKDSLLSVHFYEGPPEKKQKNSRTPLLVAADDQKVGTKRFLSGFFFITHAGSMGRTVYLPTWDG